jgi:hypothetical protein
VATSGWSLRGNGGTAPPADFLGTIDDQPLVVKVAGHAALEIRDGAIALHASTGASAVFQLAGDAAEDAGGRLRIAIGARSAGHDGLTLTETGDVGIGTERPTTRLEVNGTATVEILQITGGADLAEAFATDDAMVCEPGTVMVIDAARPGHLRISDRAYDRKVAGVVSGGGGLRPGLSLAGAGGSAETALVALAGRVVCKAEALSAPIEPGDLLTTSDVAGHAMRATDHAAASGAILGKAMSALPAGLGSVLVLVNLQ